ncbi:MAG: hypothetical protein IJT74_05335 [Bacteroidales bacterium]|nr:hypothetical protein [Bacteroidales bacterium]
MKTVNKILTLLALVPILAISCKEKEQPYTPGEKEDENCYGVYFPTQPSVLELDPAAALEMTIKVSRTNASGDIKVPLVISQEENIFQFEDLVFENGEEETELKVTFPNMTELNKEYSCSIAIKDPKYAKLYGTTTTDLSFTVSRVKWNDVEGIDPVTGEKTTVGYWVDDFMTTWYGVNPVKMEVKVQEHSQIPGYYRMESPYCSTKYIYNDPGDWDTSKTYYLYVHAEDPDFVWLPKQETGMAWSYGMVTLWSESGYSIEKDGLTLAEAKAEGNGGKLVKGVVTFQKNKLLCTMATLGGWYYGNGSGAFRFILPGGVEVDYSWSAMQAGLSEDGKLPVQFTLGADITAVKYMSFEGALAGEELDEALAEFKAAKDLPEVTESGVVDFAFEKTGVYTLIAGGYDKDGEVHGTTTIVLYYLADGDEAEVEVEGYLQGISLEDLAEGISPETSLSFMIKGTDLQEVKMGIYKSVDVLVDKEGCVEELLKSDSVDEKELAKINDKGLIGTASGLIPGTDFVMIVWASNGYSEKVVFSDIATTAGDPLPIYLDYDYTDRADELIDGKSASDFYGTYNLYAIDMNGSISLRTYMGQATIAAYDVEKYGEVTVQGEAAQISGLGCGIGGSGFDDTILLDFCELEEEKLGFWVASKKTADKSAALYTWIPAGNDFYNWAYASVAYPVADGYIAFVGRKSYTDNYGYYSNINFYNGSLDETFYDYLLVDPAKDDNGVAPKAIQAIQSYHNRYKKANYVEVSDESLESVKGMKAVRHYGTFVPNDNIHFGLKKAPVKVSEHKSNFSKEFKANAKIAF